jgi:hypothetical protein
MTPRAKGGKVEGRVSRDEWMALAQKLCDTARRRKPHTRMFVGLEPCGVCAKAAREKLAARRATSAQGRK